MQETQTSYLLIFGLQFSTPHSSVNISVLLVKQLETAEFTSKAEMETASKCLKNIILSSAFQFYAC